MSTRTVRIIYTANAAPFIAQTTAAAGASRGLAAQSAAAGANVARVGGAARSAAGSLGLFNPRLLGAAGVVVGLKSAAGAALDFEREATKLQTQIGLSAEAADELSAAARRIGVETGIGGQAAVEASFFIASAGLRGQAAMEALEFSAQAARVGLGDVSVVADLLTSAMNAYGTEVLSAEEGTEALLAAVKEGKAEAPELAGALGGVLPVASEMGVTFAEVAGNIANMTRTGTNAASAGTQLQQLMVGLLKPSQGAAQAMEEFGLSAAGLRRQVREEGLFEALMSIREAVGDNEEGLNRIFPNLRAFRGALDLTGAAADANAESLMRVLESTGNLNEAIAIVGDSAPDAAARFKAAFQDIRLTVGESIMPILATGMEGLSSALQLTADDFVQFSDKFNIFVQGQAAVDGIIDRFRDNVVDLADDLNLHASAALTDAQRETGKLERALLSAGDQFDEFGDSTDDATAALDAYNQMVRETFDPIARLNRAVEDVDKAQRDYTDAVNEYGRESDEAKQAAFDLTGALFDLESAARDGDLSFADFEGQLARFVREGKLTVEQAELMRQRVEELTGAAENYSGDYVADLQVNFDEDLLLQASAALDNAARPRTVDFVINPITPTGFTAGPVSGQFAGRVDGGRVEAGTPYVVGEHGRELFVPDRSGTIMSRAETQNVGSGKTYQLSVNTVRSDVNVMEQFRRMELLDV